MWKPGDIIVWRAIYRGCIWHAIPMFVVRDSPEEIALAIIPGADGFVPEGYSEGKQNGKRPWNFIDRPWKLEKFIWHTNRFLLLLEPQKYYAIEYLWHAASNEFQGYYINFQMPLHRSHCGVDAMDLELDLVIKPDFSFEWKDLDDYQKGIDSGIILPEGVSEIEKARQEILDRLSKRRYPFDGSWLNWKPSPHWPVATLPTGWDKV